MKVRILRPFILAIVFSAATVAGAHAVEVPAVSHWFADSLINVFPQDPPQRSELARSEYLAARNSHLSIQWVLRSRRRVENVRVEVEGLGASARDAIPAQVRAVGYVVVSSDAHYQTPPSEFIHLAPALFPDALLEKFPIALDPDKAQAIWIILSIPADAEPGYITADWCSRRVEPKRPATLSSCVCSPPRCRRSKL